jgi:hypothetical protein
MRNTIWSKHIPTLLGIAIITIGIAITSFLVKSGTIFIGQAEPLETPQNLTITNISDTSFTVSYLTENDVIGSVNFGKDKNLEQAAFDERDQKEELVAPHKIHSITIKDLTPKTQYFFSITSGQKTFLENSVPFEVSTGQTIQTQPLSQISLKGYVILPNGDKPKEAMLHATTENAQVISTFVKEDGSYIIPLSSMRAANLSSYFTFGENTIIKILIVNETFKSNVSVSVKQNTLPTVTLSNDYDFTTSATPIASKSGEPIIGFPSIPIAEVSESQATASPRIILPKKDQEFSDQQPQFSGTAIPNKTIKIIVHSPEDLEAEVTADAFGNWKYRPTTPLPPGQHTITIITRDVFGALRTITQSFVVFAQGTQVNQSATPSATPTLAFPKSPTPTPKTPTPLPSPTPTPTKTLAIAPTLTPTPPPVGGPSPTPTLNPLLTPTTLSPTPFPTIGVGGPIAPLPILSLTPTPITSITPVVTIAPPGDSSVLTVGILGFATAAIGLLLFLLTLKGF